MANEFLRAATAAAIRKRLPCARCEPLGYTAVPHIYISQGHLLLRNREYECTSGTNGMRSLEPPMKMMSSFISWPFICSCRCLSTFASHNLSSRGKRSTTSVSRNSNSDSSNGHAKHTQRSSADADDLPGFTVVTDASSHWLPCLAKAKIRQGVSFGRISAAAKGDSKSADVETVDRRAMSVVKKAGLCVPKAAIVLFTAEWSGACRALREWLSLRVSSLQQSLRRSREEGKTAALELIVATSEKAPMLLQTFGVSSLPHCLLMLDGRVVDELPAGASDARREALMAAVSLAMSTGSSGTEAISPRDRLLDQLEGSIRQRADPKKIQSLLHQLKEGLFSPLKGRDLGSHPPVRRGSSIINNGAGLSAFQSPVKLGSEDKQNERSSPAGYLLDADERAARLAARGTVALFDVPQLKTTDLEAVHEVISWAMDIRQGSSGTKLRKDALPASMDMRGALQELTGTEEPLWASDDCPIIRCLPLYNQLLLNKSLFTKARGAQPLPPPAVSTAASSDDAGKTTCFADDCMSVPLWKLAEWLARTRRCLAARLFLDKTESAGLKLAMKSHVDWLTVAAKCNYMRIDVNGDRDVERAVAAQSSLQHVTWKACTEAKRTGVHPFNVWLEPRAPSPGRTLLSCMYAALGPDDRRVQDIMAQFDVAVTAHEFYPAKFSHTRARRGGKPRMMRGRSGRWFWLGPYWKPPWAPKRKSFTEDWHLTNVAA